MNRLLARLRRFWHRLMSSRAGIIDPYPLDDRRP